MPESERLAEAATISAGDLEEIRKRVVTAVEGGGTDRSAHYAERGRWIYSPIDQASRWVGEDYDHVNWTSGFWVGALLRLSQLGSEDESLQNRATVLNARIAGRAGDQGTHDIGFLFYPSAALVADLFTDPSSAATALQAAAALAQRAVHPSGHLQAFGHTGEERSRATSTIDTMMNLPLLCWASRHTGDRAWMATAVAHADRTLHSLIRPDGSTYHLAHISDTGEPMWQGTFQGAADDSCWARGQAWGIAGYITMACETGALHYRKAAIRLLDYYCNSHDLAKLTPNDLAIDTGIQDSSAAAIVCYGLALAIAHDPALADALRAEERLASLFDTLRREALLQDTVGVLAHACYSSPHRLGLDGPLPYGEYFYLTALAMTFAGTNLMRSAGRPWEAQP